MFNFQCLLCSLQCYVCTMRQTVVRGLQYAMCSVVCVCCMSSVQYLLWYRLHCAESSLQYLSCSLHCAVCSEKFFWCREKCIVYSVQLVVSVSSVMHSSLCSIHYSSQSIQYALCNELPCLRDHILPMGGASPWTTLWNKQSTTMYITLIHNIVKHSQTKLYTKR